MIFNREAPLHLEIGFGQGDYLLRQAMANPELNYIGIENSFASVKKTLRRLGKERIKNVRLVYCDAHLALRRLFHQGSISKIISLFPCPWPKKRHEKRRLFSKEFLVLANNRLMERGEIHVVTDHKAFGEWIMEQSQGTGLDLEVSIVTPGFHTKYERKWLDLGQEEFYKLTFRKTSHLAIEEEDFILRSYKLENPIWENLELFTVCGPITLKAKEIVEDKARDVTMVRFLVSEDGFVQYLWIEIRKKDNHWHLGPSKGSMFYPTKGVQLALDLLYERLSGKSYFHLQNMEKQQGIR